MKRALLLLLVITLLIPSPALADYSDADYYGTIIVSNNSTATTNVATVCTINTTNLQAQGWVNSSANNTYVVSTSGADVAFMPGYTPGGYPWSLFVPSIGTSTQLTDIIYTGNVSGGKIRYFPASGGMTITDAATMEPSGNFSTELSTFADTATGNKTLIYKQDAFRVKVPNAGSSIEAATANYSEQLTATTTVSLYNGAITRAGERFNNFIATTIWRVAFKLDRNSTSPTGTVYIRVRKVSDDSIIGTIATLNSADIIATPLTEYSFESDIAVTTPQDIRITVEYSGGSAANYVRLGKNAAAGSARGWYTTYNAGYTDDATQDAYFKISYSQASVTATTSSGEKTVSVNMTSPFFGMNPNGAATLPVTGNLVLNNPFWQPDQQVASGGSFDSIDPTVCTNTVTNAVASDAGYVFDGAGDYIEGDNNAALDFVAGDFSIQVWAKVTNTTGGRYLYVRGLINSEGYIFLVGGADALYLYSNQAATNQEHHSPINTVILNEWHLYTVTRTGATTHFYRDATDITSSVGAFNNPTTSVNTYKIGTNNAMTGAYMLGTIGQILIYSDVLTPAEVAQNYNATKSKFSSGDIYTYSTLIPVPDNANNTVIGGDATPYIESFDFYKGGNHRSHIEWEYTAGDFIDSTGNGNDATPTYRTASSSAYVSATLATFAPVAEAKAPAYTLSEAPAFFTTAPWLSGTFTTNITGATYPGHDVIVAIALGGETPEQFLTYILVIIIVISIGLSCAWFLAKYARGDTVLVLAIVIFAMLCIGVPLKVVDVWQIYFFVIMAGGIRELEKDSRGV